MSIKIVADSACDLPKDIIDKYNIDVIPLLVYVNEKEYLDGETIQPKELLDEMKNGAITKTAQVPIEKFHNVFKKYAEENKTVIYIAFSSNLSGTYQTAELVRNNIKEEYPKFDLTVIDTKGASVGVGLTVHKAAAMAKEGKSKEEIIKAINFYKEHMEHIFTVDDLEYLCRGGRVSRTSNFVAGVLNIKPILHIEDGKLIPIEKIRGRNKAIKRMVEIMEERGIKLNDQVIGINHGDDLESALKLKDMIIEKFGSTDFIINYVGSAIGAHSGPGTLSAFFLNQESEY